MPRFDKAIVVNPPNPPGYVSNKDSMGGFGQLFPTGATFFPPLDLVYLASFLAAKGVSVEVLECLALEISDRETADRIAHSSSSASSEGSTLVVVRTSAPTLDWDLSVCRRIRAAAGQVRIGIYGPVVPHVSWRIQREPCVDYMISGEPDETVLELVRGEAQEAIQGLAFRRSGDWIANPGRLPLRALDDLPFPKWELFPYTQYQIPKSSMRDGLPFLPMLTSRGCPIGCHYCPYPVGQGLTWRARSARNVVEEIAHLVKDLGVRYITFRDPMFSLNQKRVMEICEEIVQRGLRFEWRCETRIDFLKEATLKAMAQAGCVGVNFGVESADVEIQAGVGRKPIHPEQFAETMRICRRLGIQTFAFFIIGLPGDTVRTILNTIGFAVTVQPDWVQFTAASPFVGTKLRDWAVSQGWVADDQYAYVNSHEILMGNENLSKAQLRPLLRFAQFIQTYLINRRGLLKDETRREPVYRAARQLADFVGAGLARTVFSVGREYYKRRLALALGAGGAG
jgi:anaerobic magnesium-protoporphyrin IX monomethyl ester cyclase